MRHYPMPLLLCFLLALAVTAQTKKEGNETVLQVKEQVKATAKKPKILFGTASYYADKFNGRKTASGENYDHSKATAACNAVPLGTWLKVTNIKNKKSVIVKVNDRLHPRMKRVVDLSKSGAEKLGYVRSGLTDVKVEVLGRVRPKEGA